MHLIDLTHAAQVVLVVACGLCHPSTTASASHSAANDAEQLPHAADDMPHITRTLHQASTAQAKTFTATGSGRWSSKLTWAGGVVPQAGSHVGIPVGAEVLLDRQVTVRSLTINGTLRCNGEASSGLTAASVTVYGLLECGTQEAPLDAAVSFTATLTGKERQVLVGGCS